MKAVLNLTKCIIFDLGGVLLNIDYQQTSQAFIHLGVEEFDTLYTQAKQNKIFDRFEKGQISDQEFRDYIKEMTSINLEDNQIDKAWNAMLLDFPIERMVMLEALKQDYQLILMSNTNNIHIKSFVKIINETVGMDRFVSVFDQLYYSSDIGKRKPDTETFEWIISTNNLKANECLFIDDSVQHIQGAEQVGIATHHLRKGEDVMDLFNN